MLLLRFFDGIIRVAGMGSIRHERTYRAKKIGRMIFRETDILVCPDSTDRCVCTTREREKPCLSG